MNKKLITGVDIGGSKINIIAWNGREVIDNWRTEKVSLVKLKEGISYFDALKIGIGVAGILDCKTGCILNSSNLKFFEGLCFRKIFKKDIRLDNDVNCFLRAEAKLGAVKGYKNILAVVMGTGIGGAIIINQKLIYQGSHGSAGEFGQMILDDGKTWEKLYQISKGNDQKQAEIHAFALANLINIFDPEIIVLGGGGAKLPKRELMEKFIVSPLAKKTKVVFGELGSNAVAIGAALLF